MPAFGGSYRERLRAGGRGALQRSAEAGLVPRATPGPDWAAYDQGYMAHQSGLQNGTAMDYGMRTDSQLLYSGQEQMPSDEFWGTSMNSPQYSHIQQGPMQEVPDFYQQQMVPQPQELLLPLMLRNHSEAPSMMQMGSMTPHGQTPQMGPMTAQMGPMTPHMPWMQMQVPQMELGNLGERSPAECMAIVMPGAGQFPGSTVPIDKDLMELQLKAAAELQQCYED